MLGDIKRRRDRWAAGCVWFLGEAIRSLAALLVFPIWFSIPNFGFALSALRQSDAAFKPIGSAGLAIDLAGFATTKSEQMPGRAVRNLINSRNSLVGKAIGFRPAKESAFC
jgi:hypothetical protein